MSVLRVGAFFQHMPPYSGAAALRGASVMTGLSGLEPPERLQVRVWTTTPSATPLPGLTVTSLPVPEVENAQGLLARAVGEIRMGWVAARHMFNRAAACDMVVVSTPAYVAALVITGFARWHRVPYVLELRDVYPQVYAEAGLVKRSSWLYRSFAWLSRRMYLGAQQVITATQGLEREVRTQAPGAQVQCVYNGFPSALATRRNAKHDRFTVCFHGVLGFFQDVETLVEVARVLQAADVDVVAIGYGRKEQVLQQAGLPNLRFLGRLSFEDTMAQVERCHLGLCLRLDDGISKDAFPVKVWEYMGLGIPSVVTPPCEAGHFLQEHACGLQFKTGDVRAIVDAVLTLKNDPLKMAAMTQRCQATGARFTREQTGRAAAELIHRAARKIRPN